MMSKQIWLSIVFGAVLAATGCSDDDGGTGGSGGTGGTGGTGGSGGTVDTTGACGIVCEGGDFDCVIDGLDPADGLVACVTECQAQWPNEQDAECVGQASFVIECVDANQSCDTLDVETCGTAADEMIACATGTQ